MLEARLSPPLSASLAGAPLADAPPRREVDRLEALDGDGLAASDGLAGSDDATAETQPLWLTFVNTDDLRRTEAARRGHDVLLDFDLFVDWLGLAGALDGERAAGHPPPRLPAAGRRRGRPRRRPPRTRRPARARGARDQPRPRA
jgi:hypothetical protein